MRFTKDDSGKTAVSAMLVVAILILASVIGGGIWKLTNVGTGMIEDAEEAKLAPTGSDVADLSVDLIDTNDSQSSGVTCYLVAPDAGYPNDTWDDDAFIGYPTYEEFLRGKDIPDPTVNPIGNAPSVAVSSGRCTFTDVNLEYGKTYGVLVVDSADTSPADNEFGMAYGEVQVVSLRGVDANEFKVSGDNRIYTPKMGNPDYYSWDGTNRNGYCQNTSVALDDQDISLDTRVRVEGRECPNAMWFIEYNSTFDLNTVDMYHKDTDTTWSDVDLIDCANMQSSDPREDACPGATVSGNDVYLVDIPPVDLKYGSSITQGKMTMTLNYDATANLDTGAYIYARCQIGSRNSKYSYTTDDEFHLNITDTSGVCSATAATSAWK